MKIFEVLTEASAIAGKGKGVHVLYDRDSQPDGLGARVSNTPRVMIKQLPSTLFTVVYISDLSLFTQDQDARTYADRYGRAMSRKRPADLMAANKMGPGELASYREVPGLEVIQKADRDEVRRIIEEWFPSFDVDGFMGQFKTSAEKRVKRERAVVDYKGTEVTFDNESEKYLDMVKGMLDTLHRMFDSHGVGFLLDGSLFITTDKRVTSFGRYNEDEDRVYLNPLYVDRPGAYITLIHEYGHRLHRLIGFDDPVIKQKFEDEVERAKAKRARGDGKSFALDVKGDVVLRDGDNEVRGGVSMDDGAVVFTPKNGDPAVRFSQHSVSTRGGRRLVNLDGSKVIVPHSEYLYTDYSYTNELEMFTELFTRYILKYDRSSESMAWMKDQIVRAKK